MHYAQNRKFSFEPQTYGIFAMLYLKQPHFDFRLIPVGDVKSAKLLLWEP